MVGNDAKHLTCDRKPYSIELDEGPRVPARAVIIASGAEYRRLSITNLAQFEGTGVYYAATFMEAQLCGGDEVVVVGGGNSAGQAAVFLAQTARRVHMVVRSDGLADTMSRYLIRRIEDHPAIVLHVRTEIVGLEGDHHLERVTWRDNQSGREETQGIRHVFSMTGARPSTAWLQGCLTLDARGFIKTGPDLSADDLAAAHWPLARPPHPAPGGDVGGAGRAVAVLLSGRHVRGILRRGGASAWPRTKPKGSGPPRRLRCRPGCAAAGSRSPAARAPKISWTCCRRWSGSRRPWRRTAGT